MRYLDLALLNKNLKREEGADDSFIEGTPPGYETGFFDEFLKVLYSNEDDERLDDISSEDIVKMLENGDKLFDLMFLEDDTLKRICTRLSRKKSSLSTFKRRVL